MAKKINNNLGQFVLPHPSFTQNSPELLLLKFLPSTYTNTAISWPPPLISQLFHICYFEQGCTVFYSHAVFTSFCNILWGLDVLADVYKEY